MAIKLSSNPTCVLSDADNISLEQRQKINLNLSKGIPGSDIEGDKVTVINSDGEVEMKAYSTGGGGTSYTAGDGISISDDTISAKIDGSSITLNASGELQASGGGFSPTLYATASQGVFSNMPEDGLQGWYVLECKWSCSSGSGIVGINVYWEDTYMGPSSICHVTSSNLGTSNTTYPVYTLFHVAYKNTATIKIEINGDGNVVSPTISSAKIYAI